MKAWIDGMGRRTIKYPTGTAQRYDPIFRQDQLIGVCRAPNWVVIWGPFQVHISNPPVQREREWMAAQARHKRLPGHQRDLRLHLD